MSESLWDVSDVVKFLKVSRSWVYAQCDAGKLPHKRIVGVIRFDPDVIRSLGSPEQSAPVVPIRGV